MSDEDVIYVKLTGKEVHKAVRNYVKDHLNIDPASILNAALTEARQASRDAIERHVKTELSGERNLDWHFRQAISAYIASDAKRYAHQVLESAAIKVVREYRDQLEAEVRKEFENNIDSIIAKVVKK